jgi:hypothetical protein
VISTDPDVLVGKTEEEVAELLNSLGLKWRVIARDGGFFFVTLDYDPARYNLTIDRGKIVKVEMG